jgi:hypothetical protein
MLSREYNIFNNLQKIYRIAKKKDKQMNEIYERQQISYAKNSSQI